MCYLGSFPTAKNIGFHSLRVHLPPGMTNSCIVFFSVLAVDDAIELEKIHQRYPFKKTFYDACIGTASWIFVPFVFQHLGHS